MGWFVRLRWLVVPGYLAACGLILWLLGMQIGTELFPQIDSGQFVLRFRPPPGSNFELTRQMAVKCLEEIEREAKPENIEITMGFVGQVAPNFGIDNMVLFMRGPDDGQLRVALREESGIKLAEFRERLRKVLPERVIPWLAKRLEQGGLSTAEAERQAKLATFGFEPGDIVTNVMSFGSPTPIAVRVVGTDLKLVRQHAEKIAGEMRQIPFLRDVQFEQQLDYPTVEVDIDREKAGLSGAKVEDVAHALVMATSSTRFANLNYWIDVKTGFDYLVQLQIPPLRMDKPEDIETLPLESVNPLVNLMVRDVATVRKGVRPGEIDRDMSQRYLTLVANVEGEDMGRASRQVAEAIDAAGEPPRGVRVEPMGQLPPMIEMFKALGIGLGGRRVRDLRAPDGLLPVAAPGPDLDRRRAGGARGDRDHPLLHQHLAQHRVVHGLDHVPGRLGVELGHARDVHGRALEGRDRRRSRRPSSGAGDRLRPILMTACAMTVGMVPMALALEKGSQMQAPLGRAVIGGLVMSTFATLLVLPSIFALVIGRKVARSPSIYPDDPESKHYDPRVFVDEADPATHGDSDARRRAAPRRRRRRCPTTVDARPATTTSSSSSGGSSTRPGRSGTTWSRITPSTTSGSPSASTSPGTTTGPRPAPASTREPDATARRHGPAERPRRRAVPTPSVPSHRSRERPHGRAAPLPGGPRCDSPPGPESRVVPAAAAGWSLCLAGRPRGAGLRHDEQKADVTERLEAPDRAGDPAARSGTSSGSSGSRASSRATSARRSIRS